MYHLPKIDTLIFLGGGTLLLKICNWCVEKKINIKVITSPRHANDKLISNCSLFELLEKKSIKSLVTDKIKIEEISSFVGEEKRTCFISIAAPWLFTQEHIEQVFSGRLLNVHGTRLPQGRGGAPISWQIMMGSKLGFCQLHKVTPELDEGDIIVSEEFLYSHRAYKPKHFISEYEQRNVKFLQNFILEVTSKEMSYQTFKQPSYLSTYYPRLDSQKNSWIDWGDTVESLFRFICAFDDPYPGAQTFLNGVKIKVKTVQVDYSDPSFHSYQNGLIYRKTDKWVCVCANGGSLIVSEILDQYGKNIISRIKLGDRLSTPRNLLDERLARFYFRP